MSDKQQSTLYVAIVPTEGHAYYLNEERKLVAVPLDGGYAYVAGPEVSDPDDGSGEVDWLRAFESDSEREAVSRIASTLRVLPDDATAPRGRVDYGKAAVETGTPEHDWGSARSSATTTVTNVLHYLDSIGEDDPAAILSSAAANYFAEKDSSA
jgi:hypothetical protein